MQISNPTTNRPYWYDRSDAFGCAFYKGNGIAPHSATARFNYTVPTSKAARIGLASLFAMRYTVATTNDYAEVRIVGYPTGGAVPDMFLRQLYTNTNGLGVAASGNMNIIAQAGREFQGFTSDASTGGTINYSLSLSYTEYDA